MTVEPIEPTPALPAPRGAVGARTILLVEDDDDIREIVADVLTTRGYSLITAENGRRALDVLRGTSSHGATRPSLILLDMMMPDMDGRQFLSEQRLEPGVADIPVVVLTASGRTRQPADVQVAAWLTKPIELEVLLAAVSRFCGPPEPRRPGRPEVAGLAERVPEFLTRRRRELTVLAAALAHGDHLEVRVIAHNLKGTAGGFGFPELSALGARLEAAAIDEDIAAMRLVIEELRAAVGRLVAGPAGTPLPGPLPTP